MIRIVGLNRNENPMQEFLLLQNQGSLRQNIRGLAVVAEASIDDGARANGVHLFAESELIPAGCFILLRTGVGIPRWTKTKDGQLIYNAYIGRDESLWINISGPIHVLTPQHTWVERKEHVTVV
jgi:hypothetical protein